MGERSETIEALDIRARELQSEDRWDAEAEEVNHRILELDRGHPAAAIRLGRCFEASGRLQEAMDLYTWAGENSDSSVARARAERLRQDMRRAEKEGVGVAAAPPRASGGRAPALPPRVMSAAEAQALLDKCLPADAATRELVVGFFAETIALARSIDAGLLFVLPLDQNRSFRLMGGRLSLGRPYKDGLYVEIDPGAADAKLVDELEAGGMLDRHTTMRDIPAAVGAHVPYTELAAWAPRLRAPHDAYVRQAMQTPLGGHHGRHQPALLEALAPQGTP